MPLRMAPVNCNEGSYIPGKKKCLCVQVSGSYGILEMKERTVSI